MRRKRLQHAADTLCHMFCGWRLINSYRELERLGSGRLTVDALTEACTHNDRPIPSLSIARELSAWLRADLAAHNIELSHIREANLSAELSFGAIARAARESNAAHFDADGQQVAPPRFLVCDIACRSRVATDERVYTSEYRDREEWPPGWPASVSR